MKKQPLKALALISALVGGLTATAVQATEVSDVLKAGAAKVQTAKTSQTKVDRIADQTDELLQEFKQVNKQIESLRVYNSQLDRQIDSQKVMMAELKESIANATVIERGVSPLMVSMLAGLEDFVALDMPFKKDDRLDAIADLNINLDSAKFSAAEKFRQILELYDIESEYSLSLESYRDMIDINADGSEVEVDMLRVGRVALMYQTKDKSQSGAWNKTTGSWETLDSEYRRPIDQGIRIAKKLNTQDVMEMPITAPEAAQ
ncbi:DUF3450 domain-containing protein [Porticoccaceae bacterium]|jgi:hypothetical protein|nr:DUF3450 domain-containing protein [Porticoccaceae bacterium]MDA8598603.1 DUF3450 domain-containing protein [Porticoccaceae bacterium]MDA9583187.1 DUF3450 domain-containing protein [Porticoccaceae bacterium]MDB2399881.1 DUF3450 domain-containing protein [Porticoccaceae bacterium]MDB2558755.1 DUF3450 domain-containing protein [Porticoccaceae bacterium]